MKKTLLFVLLLSACSGESDPVPVADLGTVDARDRNDVLDMSSDLSVADVDIDSVQDAQDLGADTASNCAPTLNQTTSEGHVSDGWRWTKRGRVFATDPVPAVATEGDFGPTLIRTDDGFRLYVARKRANGFSLFTATSADGLTWSDPVPVTGLEGDNYPSALATPNGVRLWFGSGSFDVATSTDGVNFMDQQRGILRPSDVGGYASLSMIYPNVRVDDTGLYRMWFTGFDGTTLRIGTASSPDGVDWTPSQNAVMERTGGTEFDSTSVSGPEVHQINGTYYMWYSGYDTSNTDPGPWRIGLATSPNGVVWERQGVSIPLVENGDDMWSTRDAAVIPTDDGFLMVYVGMSDDSHYRLLVATSDACP